MNVKLNSLTIANFKGISAFSAIFGGEHAVISGANGTGKTTVADAFGWLMDGKDTTGRVASGKGSFDITPLDGRGKARKGLVTAVRGEIDFDGTVHALRKELHEKVSKKKDQVMGYESSCWIDDVPHTLTEYEAWIAERVAEDKFRLLSSITYFFTNFHWKKRRGVLCEFAGEVGTPEGSDDLLAALNGRTVDQYAKVLKEQKGLREKERDEINPRIDEISKGMEGYETPADETGLRDERESVKVDIERLDRTRKELLESEQQRQKNLEAINALCGKRVKREMDLKNSTAGIQHLLDAKKVIEEAVTDRTKAVTDARNARALKDSEVRTKNVSLQAEQRALTDIQAEYKVARNAKSNATCYACDQPLPEDKVAEVDAARIAKLKTVEVAGNTAMERVNVCKAAITDLASECHALQEQVGQAEIKLTEAKNYRDEKLPQIENQIDHKETIKPKDDAQWQGIVDEVKVLQDKVGEPVSGQLTSIEDKRAVKMNRLAEINNSLARADRHKEDKARITELGEKEKTLAQAIADLEKQLAEIDKYNATVSGMVESAVNGRFTHVRFKLFNTLLNGTIEDCCEAILKGTPYPDMSCGEKSIVGIDIINVLSEHYDLSVPIFIDNAESLTLPIESNSQTVELYAKKSVKKMTVEQVEQRKAVA